MSTMTKPRKQPIFVLAEQLVQTWIRNEADLTELEKLHRKSERVRMYMRKPGANSTFALAYLTRVDKARQDISLQLHARRRDALALIAQADGELGTTDTAHQSTTSTSPAASCFPRSSCPLTRKYA
jgi:hypothetical protein